MIIKVKSPNVVLKTKDKYLTEDIQILVDESVVNGEYSTLKTLLDTTKKANHLFQNYKGESIVGLISYNDTENVEAMIYMFNGCSNITDIALNTSNVTDMGYAFQSCHRLTNLSIGTGKVTNFQYAFSNCDALIDFQLDISNATNITYAFDDCNALTNVKFLASDVSKLVNVNMSSTFRYCSNLTKVDIPHYNISNTGYSNYMCSSNYRLKTVIIRSFGDNYVLHSTAFDSCYRMLHTANSTYNPDNTEDGYIYVPQAMIETLQAETNWSTLFFRPLEEYIIPNEDGTIDLINGVFDDTKAGLV